MANLIDPISKSWKYELFKKHYPYPLCIEILHLPLPKTDNIKGELLWRHSSSGEYKVKKAYHLLQHLDQTSAISYERPFGIPHYVWKLIWKVKLHMKILSFIWKLLHDNIPVFAILNRKGITTPTRCLLFDDNDETINHMFLTCSFARAIWLGSTLGIRTSDLANVSFKDWLTSLITTSYPPEQNRMIFL